LILWIEKSSVDLVSAKVVEKSKNGCNIKLDVHLDWEENMSSRSLGIVLMVVGVLVGLAAVLADSLGIGGSPGTFGSRQLLGLGAGIVILVIGIFLYLRANQSRSA